MRKQSATPPDMRLCAPLVSLRPVGRCAGALVVVSAVLWSLGAGVASAEPDSPAAPGQPVGVAKPKPKIDSERVPDARREIVTDDGWKVLIRKSGEKVDRYPNLAQSPQAREGFTTLKAVAEISGNGKVPVQSASVTTGYQLGCNTDVSSGITLTGGLSDAITTGISPTVGVNLSGTGQGGTTGGQGSGTVGGNAGVTGNLSNTLTATGQLSGTLKPGTITTIPYGTKPLQGSYGAETFRDVHIKVTACIGPVSLRSFATVSIVTARNTDSVTAYGRPVIL